jgi:DNA-binding NarL/FixJ family response regulator
MLVVGESANGRAAVASVRAHRPDVLLADVRMPEMDGIEATARITATTRTRVLVLTTFNLDEYVYRALEAGASGFLLKESPPEQLVAAIRLIASGDALLAPARTRSLISQYVRPRLSLTPGPLTSREVEVLRFLAEGLSNAEITAKLTLSEATVRTHVSHILSKLGARSRVQAAIWAYKNGLVD